MCGQPCGVATPHSLTEPLDRHKVVKDPGNSTRRLEAESRFLVVDILLRQRVTRSFTGFRLDRHTGLRTDTITLATEYECPVPRTKTLSGGDEQPIAVKSNMPRRTGGMRSSSVCSLFS